MWDEVLAEFIELPTSAKNYDAYSRLAFHFNIFCRNNNDASAVVSNFLILVKEFGMNGAACGVLSGPRITAPDFYFAHWPPQWMEYYVKNECMLSDPVVRWARRSGQPSVWRDIFSRVPRRDPARNMMQAVAKHGFSEGLSLPMRGGDGRLGLVALAGDRGPLGVLEQEFLRIVSASAFAAMDRIRNAHVEIDLAPNFSQRELSCLWLLARGLSYDEIAVSLDLSERTVRFHLANASDKAGAKSRTHLVSIVTRQGWIDP